MGLTNFYILLSVILVGLISFVGIITFAVKLKNIEKILLYLVCFSVGALFGDVFIHLIPESFERIEGVVASIYIISGILFSFIIEKFIHWRHCHIRTSDKHPHRLVYMNIAGDSIHNFVDGLIIASSYLVNFSVGIATTIAVILHEIPQEIGDFGIMVYGGFSKGRALLFNFLTALTAILGAFAGILLGGSEALLNFLIPFAAGNFIYIAGTDLVPELHKESSVKKSFIQLLFIISGILVMISLLFLK